MQTPDEYRIVELRQVTALASAVRQDMVDRLARNGPTSIRELADELGLKPSSLYRHIDTLIDVGLVVEAGQRLVNRRVEKLYDCVARRVLLDKIYQDDSAKDSLHSVLAALNRQMERDAGLAIENGQGESGGAHRNLGFGRIIGTPSKKDLARINSLLEEISMILRSSSKRNAKMVAFGWSLAPVRLSSKNGNSE